MWSKSNILKKGVAALAVVAVVAPAAYFTFKKEEPNEEFHIAVNIQPYYKHAEHRAEVGEYSEGLGAMDSEVLLKTVKEMDEDWENLPVVAMYVAALRLFEIHERERALYWYQGARYRADLFMELLDDTSAMNRMGSKAYSLSQAHTAFFLALKPYLGGYGLCDMHRYEEAMNLAVFKRDTVPKLNKIYPEVVFLAEEQWSGQAEKVKARFEMRLKNTADNYDEIVKHRKATGIHERYCGADRKSPT